MREHKYKAKSQHSDEWIYGSLVITDDCTNNPMQQRLPRKRYQIMTYFAGDWNMGGWSLEDVYSETICEFTGLKDKNGIDIYEGDIMKTPTNPYVTSDRQGIVHYDDAQWFGAGDYLCEAIDSGAVVIGSVHDNIELINEQ